MSICTTPVKRTQIYKHNWELRTTDKSSGWSVQKGCPEHYHDGTFAFASKVKKVVCWTFCSVWNHKVKKYILQLQGLLSTTYQVEVAFSVKGGAEEQKSIFVKVQNSFLITWIFFMRKLKVPLTGSKAQDYKEVTIYIWFLKSHLFRKLLQLVAYFRY